MSGVEESITTEPYRVSSSTVVRLLMLRYAWRWWWLILLPPVVLCVLGVVYGVAFAIVALMLMFLVYPTLLMFVYFNEVLRPEILQTTSRQRATLNRHDVTVEYLDEPDRAANEVRCNMSDSRVTVSLDACQGVWVYREYILIQVRAHNYIALPASSMSVSQWVSVSACCQQLGR